MDDLEWKKEEAFKDWTEGKKYKEISEKYDININTVKSWATRLWKNQTKTPPKKVATKPKKVATKTEKVATKTEKVATKKKPKKQGAPTGNKNAKGNSGGAPLRNQNHFKHGGFAEIYWDSLDEQELALVDQLAFDEEAELEQQIALLTVRERRLMGSIKEFKGLQIEQETSRHLESTVEETECTKTSKISSFDALLKLETILTGVQAKKTKCIESLHKIRSDRADREERRISTQKEESLTTNELHTLSLEEMEEIERILENQE